MSSPYCVHCTAFLTERGKLPKPCHVPKCENYQGAGIVDIRKARTRRMMKGIAGT